MKSKFFLLLFIQLALISCSGSKKIKSFTEFTEKLTPSSTHSVALGPEANLGNFANELLFTQYNKAILNINTPTKFKARKIGSKTSPLATMPFILDGNIFSIDIKGNVQSYNIDSKKTNWTAQLGSSNKTSAVTISENSGKLFITSDLNLYVIDSHTGKEIIKRSLDDISKNYPLMYYNALIVQTVSNNLIAYNIDNWQAVWVYETWPEYIASSKVTMPLLVGNQIISGFSTGQLVANNYIDGKEIWQLNLSKDSNNELGYYPLDLSTQPISHDNHLFVASNNGYLMKFDLSSGRISWKKKAEDITSMIISGKTIFVTNNARQIAAISEIDGSVIWATTLQGKESKNNFVKPTFFTTPIITNNGIFVFSGDGYGYQLDSSNGLIIKSFEMPQKIKYFAIYNGDIILFDERNIYKLD